MLTRQKQLMESPPAPTYSLQPYKGEWSFQQAAHLLRRTTFGGKKDWILRSKKL